MSKAKNTELEALHGTLARKLSDLLDGIDGEAKGAAAILNVARQFLKDNNIEAELVPGSDLDNLKKRATQFPFDPAEDSRIN